MTELLTIDLVTKRDTITIKSKKYPMGKVYEVTNAADFGPVQWAILSRRADEAQTLLNKKRQTKKDEQRAQDIIDEIVRWIIPDLDPVVLREMPVGSRQMVFFTWIAKISGAAEGNAQTGSKKTPPRSTGSK